MILSAHQPSYIPWLGLVNKILLCDTFCIFNDCQISGEQWENRNRIKGPNGEFWLTVPIKGRENRGRKLYEIEIDNTQRWRNKHRKSIINSYQKAKYFSEYMSFFNEFYSMDFQYLTELNEYFLRWILAILKIDVEIVRATDLCLEGQKSDLVLDMCKKLGADVYIFGSQGEGYADKDSFEQAGIKLYFQKYIYPAYPQLYGDFVPYMSVIDLLFNVGAEKAKEIIASGNISKNNLLEDLKCQQKLKTSTMNSNRSTNNLQK